MAEADDRPQELLGALEALGGTAGNGRLRELLGWDEATYEAVKGELLTAGRLLSGRGRGGSVSLAEQSRQASPPSSPASPLAPPPGPQPTAKPNLSAFLWSVADLLRGDYKQSDYGKVILPFTVLRRLDCALEPSKEAVLAEKPLRESQGLDPDRSTCTRKR